MPTLRAVPLALAAILFGLCASTPAQVLSNDDGESWFLIEFDGTPAGYTRIVTEAIDDGAFSVFNESRMRLARLGTELEIAIEQTQVEDEHGHVSRVSSRTSMPGEVRSIGVVDGELLRLAVTEVTGTREFDEAWDTTVRGARAETRRMIAWLPTAEIGDVFESKTFDLTLGGPLVSRSTVIARDDEWCELETEIDLLPGMPSTQRMRLDGTGMEVTTAMLGMTMNMREATREEALSSWKDAAFAPEAFEQSIITPDVPLPRPRGLDRVVYRLAAHDVGRPWPDLSAPNQRVLSRSPEELVVEVHHVDPREPTALAAGRTPDVEPGPEFIQPNGWIQSDDPAIIALAERYADGAEDPWEIARRLERGVAEYIHDKNFGVAFATASEVCASRSGDCTEHSVLLASLCRAQGVPARVAMGLVYLGGIFGGHAWTEVWIDGGWYPLDGVFGLGRADPAHLRMSSSALDGAGMAIEMFGAITLIGSFDLHIVEYEKDGEVVRPGDDDVRPFVVDGATLAARTWGFRADAPATFTWSDEVPAWTSGLVARARGPDDTRLIVRAHPVSYDFDGDDLAAVLGGDPNVSVPVKVAGRPGLVTDAAGWSLLAWDGDTVFEWRVIGMDDDESIETLMAMAKTVAFD